MRIVQVEFRAQGNCLLEFVLPKGVIERSVLVPRIETQANTARFVKESATDKATVRQYKVGDVAGLKILGPPHQGAHQDPRMVREERALLFWSQSDAGNIGRNRHDGTRCRKR